MENTKEAPVYTIKVLSESEFNKLPYKKIMDTPDDVLGAADPKTNIAYVKDTGYADITKQTMEHELDELLANVSPHEVDGIRYKSGGGIGSLLKSFGGAAKGAAKGVAGGIGKAAGGIGDFFGGGAAPTPSAGGGNFLNNVFPMTGPGMNKTLNSAPALSKAFTSAPAAAGPSAFSKFASGAGDMFKKIGGSQTFQDIAGPAAISLAGNMFAPKVQTPDFSGVRGDLENRIGSGGTNPELKDRKSVV